jgi:membrane protease YdiL (CAAX protease family)
VLSEKPWKPEAVLKLGAMICLSLLTGMIVVTGMGQLFSHLARRQQEFYTFVVGALCFQGAALVWIHLFIRGHGVGWCEAFGFSIRDWQRVLRLAGLSMLVALPGTFLLGYASEAALTMLGLKPELQAAVKLLQNKPSVGQFVVYGIGAILLAPVAEETMFRGVFYPTLKQSGYPRLAMWATSLLFASTHMNLMAFVPLTFLALVLTFLYERTGNLVVPILTHVAFNAVNFALLVVQPTWLKMN